MVAGLKLKIMTLLHWVKINLYANVKFVRPDNFILNGNIIFKRGSYLSFDKRSQVTLEGNIVFDQAKIILTNSTLELNDTKLAFSQISLVQSHLKPGKGSNVYRSALYITDSKILTGQYLNIHGFSVNMSRNSEINAGEYLMLKGTNKPSGLTLSNTTFTAGANNKIEAEVVASNSTFTIGSGNFLNGGTEVRCMEKITMGDNNFVSYDCIIFDTNAHATNHELRKMEITNGFPNGTRQTEINAPKTKPITIGNCTWIGMRAAILKGTTIGEGAIVALNSVVTGNVPDFHLAFGNPFQLRKIEN